MEYRDKEDYWEEMSHHFYPILSQKERLNREYKEQEYDFLYRYFNYNECVRFQWGEW